MWKTKPTNFINFFFWQNCFLTIIYYFIKLNLKKNNKLKKKKNLIKQKFFKKVWFLKSKLLSFKSYTLKNNKQFKKLKYFLNIFKLRKKFSYSKTLFFLPSTFYINRFIIKKKILKYSLLIKKGKKLLICSIWYKILCLLKNKLNIDIFFFFQLVIIKIMPLVYFYIKYSSGRKYKIPYIISTYKSYILALHYFFNVLQYRKESTLILRLYNELLECYYLKSKSIKWKYSIYKIIRENRAFISLLKKKKKWK